MKEKLKSKKFVVPIAIVGILLTGVSASLVLDVFGEVEGTGEVSQSVVLTEDETDGDISYTIDPLTAGDITNKTFSIENQADTPIPVEYENSVEITSDGTTYNSTNLPDGTDFTEMSELVEIRVPKVIDVVSETDTNIHTVESTDMDQSFQNFEEFVDTRNYVAYKVREEIDGVDFVVNIDSDETTEQVTIEGNGSEGIHIVQLSQKDGIQSDIETNRGNSVESVDIELSETTTAGSFEMLDLVVQGESQYPESLALDNETISGETTVDRTQVSILNSYLQDGVNITLQTEVKPLGE